MPDPTIPTRSAHVHPVYAQGARLVQLLQRPTPTLYTALGLLLTAAIIASIMIGESWTPGDTRGVVSFFGWNWEPPATFRSANFRHVRALLEVATIVLVGLRWALRVKKSSVGSHALALLLVGCVVLSGTLAGSRQALFRPQAFDVRDDLHYLIGTKYFDELGYVDLYECLIVSELVQGAGNQHRDEAKRIKWIRSLKTNHMYKIGAIENSPARKQRCIDRFTPERWAEFGSDITAFREWLEPWGRQWPKLMGDHGYNGAPVLTVILSAVGNAVEISHESLSKLGLINLALVTTMLLTALWAFGWEAAAVFAVSMFCSVVESFGHAMSIPRYMWLAALVMGICFLRKEKYEASAVALVFSASLKGFPSFFLIAACLHIFVLLFRRGHVRDFLSWKPGRFLIASFVVMVVLFVVSISALQGLENWTGFFHQMDLNGNRKAGGSIGFAFNFTYSTVDKDFRTTLATLKHTVFGLRIQTYMWICATLLALAVARHASWLRGSTLTLALGFALVHLFTVPMAYYYAGYFALALLFAGERDQGPWRIMAVGLLTIDALAQIMSPHVSHKFLLSGYTSTAFTAYLLCMLAYLERTKRIHAETGASLPENSPRVNAVTNP